MNWLNLQTSTKTAPEFVGCEPIQRATWLCLSLYCAEQENGGVIRDCGTWGTRRWMQTCGVTKEEVSTQCALWAFAGETLTVWGYPLRKEAEIIAKREGGSHGGMAKTQAKIEASRANGLLHMPSSTQAKPKLEPNGREGNVMEGNVIKTVRREPGRLGSVDKYESIQAIPQSELASWAVGYCRDAAGWQKVYKTFIDKLGPEAFRSILCQFVGEVEAGEDGRVRGSVLVAKLKTALSDKRKSQGRASP